MWKYYTIYNYINTHYHQQKIKIYKINQKLVQYNIMWQNRISLNNTQQLTKIRDSSIKIKSKYLHSTHNKTI